MGSFPYAELLEFNQPNPFRKKGYTRIRDTFPGLKSPVAGGGRAPHPAGSFDDEAYDPERIVEFAGRWDYGSKNAAKLGQKTTVRRLGPAEETKLGTVRSEQVLDVPIIQKYIDMGHESMLEMADATFFIECSRVVSHELVRHRLVSYQQESQRFVRYDEEVPEELFYLPPELDDASQHSESNPWTVYEAALDTYRSMRRQGVPPQIARYVFPNATRTRLIMKTNLREWRHICKLRLDSAAQPEMRELMRQIYEQLVDVFPNVMYKTLDGDRGVR